MKNQLDLHIGKVLFEIGWYKNEPFVLWGIKLLEITELYPEEKMVVFFEIKVFKATFTIMCDEK